MPSEFITACSSSLAAMKLTIAFAESATAGRLSSEFSLTETSGNVLKGGVVCYDATLKEQLLKVPKHLIDQYTPESAEVTAAAAYGLKQLIPADIHIAVTGLACPGGSESPEKPVGTMFIHGLWGDTLFSERTVFEGAKEEVVLSTVNWVAKVLLNKLNVQQS